MAKKSNAAAVMALDLGSSSTRAILYDFQGRMVPRSEVDIEYQLETTPDGGAQANADMLVQLVGKTIDGALAVAAKRKLQVKAVAASAFWHNVLGVDEDGEAITPVLTWADTRAAGAASQLRERLDEGEVHSRTGCVLHPSYLPAKLLWLQATQPSVVRRVARWMSIGEYVYFKFTGQAACSLSMASGTGLFNQHTCAWDGPMLEALGLSPEQLSPLVDLAQPLRGLAGQAASAWPQLRDVPWFPALGDGACSNVGAGCTARERAALMVGTSGAMRVVWEADAFTIPSGLWCYRIDRRRIVMGGALSDGGNLIRWLRNLTGCNRKQVERQLANFVPDGHGLTFLPFLAGERSPGWQPQARGAITGISLATRPMDLVQAGMEAVAYRFALIERFLREAVPEMRQVLASGGSLLRSPSWMQMMADVMGRSITASPVVEASSRGAAVLALEQLGHPKPLANPHLVEGEEFRPVPAHHEVYQKAMERQADLYRKLIKA